MTNIKYIFINVKHCKIHEWNQVFDETTQQITEFENTPIKYPIKPVKYFVREKELEELVNLLNLHRTIAVVGPGGTGKKQIVFQYAFKRSDQYHHIVWFNFESIAAFTDVVHQLAGELGIATKIEDKTRPFYVILKEIYKSFNNHCVLFVFDNVLDKKVFEYFLDSSIPDDNFTLHIVLISQLENWDDEEIYCLKVTPLDELTSYTLLKEELGADYVQNSEKLWKDLAGYVGHLPLAIHLISGYVKQCKRNNLHFDIAKYIHDIDRGSSEDVPYESVKKTLDMLYQEKRSKLARRLINVSAFLNPYYINIDSLKCFIDSYDVNNFNYALNLIESYSLIKRNGSKIIMHPVIQQWIRSDQKQRQSVEKYYKLALESVLNKENNYVHRTSVLKYASANLPTILSYKKSKKEMLQCFSQYGYEQPLENIFRSESKANVSLKIKEYGLLHYAIESRNARIVELICSFDIDVNMQYGFKQNTPLHIASEIGCKNIVKYLLKKKARRNIINIDGHTPIHIASMGLHHDIIDLLIEENTNLINSLDNNKRTSLHLALLSHNFGYEEAVNKTVTLLLNNGANLEQPDLEGRTVLHYAAKGAYHQILPMILENRSELLKMADNMGWTSLHIALTNNCYEHGEHLRNTVSVLIENDQVLKAIGKSGLNKLEHEVNDSDDITARLLKNGTAMSDWQDKADGAEIYEQLVNIQDNMGRTPLQIAVSEYTTRNEISTTNIIKLLIDKGASLLVEDKMGQNVLHYAAKGARHQVIPILIDKAPKLLNMTDRAGRKPLDYAYDKYKSKIDPDVSKTVILLFSKGSVNIKDCLNRTTAHYAALCANYRFLGTLLKDYPNLLNQPDAEGWTPLHLAVNADNSIQINDIIITVELLIKMGATVESKNKMGHIVLHLAAGCARHNIVSLILKQQSSLVNIADNSGRTPLFYALERYGPRKEGNPADKNYIPGNEDYVLETARLLLKYEARTDITINGFSPFDILTSEQRQHLKSYCDNFKHIQS